MARDHYVFLSIADACGNLPELHEESRRLHKMFEKFRDDDRCSLIFKPNATWDDLYQVLTSQPDNIAIFHFGGHAREGQVLLDDHLGVAFVGGEGLAALLGRRANLKLVFLNGCSTRPHVQRLLTAGVPAVIATARPIHDWAAREFAVAFYEALTAGGEAVPAGGRCLRAAFDAACAYMRGKKQDDGRPREFINKDKPQSALDITDGDGLPWDLFVRPGSEQVERWDLFEDDPLFGLPALPADIGLPDDPFRNLQWFRREHARVFFGRGRAIRELYDLVTRPATPEAASVLLYYGQTGVGKTSVLAAGLCPRLVASHSVRYLRRSAEHGLLGTLRKELDSRTGPFDLHRDWLATERPPDGRPLLVVLDQAEEAYTQGRIAVSAGDDTETLNRPGVDPEVEVRALIEALRLAFDPARQDRPRGRFILGFRKEWLDEFEKACKAANLAFESVPLSPLDRTGVVEAIRSLASEPDRNEKWAKYRLTVTPGAPPLPDFIADDLLATLADPKQNQVYPVAPTLQFLLSRMWEAARQKDRDAPTFDRALYTDLKKKGYQLDEALDQQLASIRSSDSEAVDRGLVLDILEWFTTSLGTACPHTFGELLQRYPKQSPERLMKLLRLCQSHYILTEMSFGTGPGAVFTLSHDTLALWIRNRFLRSPLPVQQARRILESRVSNSFDFGLAEGDKAVGNRSATRRGWTLVRAVMRHSHRGVLTKKELQLIDRASSYLPRMTAEQSQLLARSRVAARRDVLLVWCIGTIIVLLAYTAFTYWLYSERPLRVPITFVADGRPVSMSLFLVRSRDGVLFDSDDGFSVRTAVVPRELLRTSTSFTLLILQPDGSVRQIRVQISPEMHEITVPL
jgi:hypothetical protein